MGLKTVVDGVSSIFSMSLPLRDMGLGSRRLVLSDSSSGVAFMARDVSQELLGSDSSEHELLNPTHSLVDEIFLASLSARLVPSIVLSVVLRHCAWLITCCSISPNFFDICMQSAIWYRASIHNKSDHFLIDVTWQDRVPWHVAVLLTREQIILF